MGYAIPTPNDFKLQLRRDFPYAVSGFGAVIALTVVAGAIVNPVPMAGGYGYMPGASVNITDPTGSGATITATVNGGALISCVLVTGGTGYTAPTATLSGGDNSNLKKVTDDDINLAIAAAQPNVNPEFFGSQAAFTIGFNYLAAHMLVENVLASVEGLASQYSWLTASKTVDGISQSFTIPQRIQDDPFLASLSTTRYGANFLKLILPWLVGHTAPLYRETNPV